MVRIDLVMKRVWKSAMLLLNVKNTNLLDTGGGGWVGRSNDNCALFLLIVFYCSRSN